MRLYLSKYHTTVVDHKLYNLANTPCQSDGAIAGRIRLAFTGFWHWYYCIAIAIAILQENQILSEASKRGA